MLARERPSEAASASKSLRSLAKRRTEIGLFEMTPRGVRDRWLEGSFMACMISERLRCVAALQIYDTFV